MEPAPFADLFGDSEDIFGQQVRRLAHVTAADCHARLVVGICVRELLFVSFCAQHRILLCQQSQHSALLLPVMMIYEPQEHTRTVLLGAH